MHVLAGTQCRCYCYYIAQVVILAQIAGRMLWLPLGFAGVLGCA
jgi:hypothetical protein